MARTAGEVNRKKLHSYYDYSLLFLILFLVCFGLVMIYSTSSYNAQKFLWRWSLLFDKASTLCRSRNINYAICVQN